MQIELQIGEGLKRTLSVTVPAERVETAVNQKLTEMRPKMRMNGFRPGKVPLDVVTREYGAEVRREVLGGLISEAIDAGVAQHDLAPVAPPSIDSLDAVVGSDVRFTASLEVMPEVVLGAVESLSVAVPQAEVSEADVAAMIDRLRRQRAQWVVVEDAAVNGDRARIDFVGRIDDEAFEGGSGEGHTLELGSGKFLADFEAGVLGMKPGETRKVPVAFPADYPAEKLQGRTAEFELTLHALQRAQPPEIDAAFCEAFGIEGGDLEALQREVRGNMERELKAGLRRLLKRAVLDGLVGLSEFPTPAALVQREQEVMRQQLAEQYRVPVERIDPSRFVADAEKRVRLGLLLGHLARTHGLRADEARVEGLLAEMAASYEQPEQVIAHYRNTPELMGNVRALAVEDAVVDWALAQLQAQPLDLSFDAVMAQLQ